MHFLTCYYFKSASKKNGRDGDVILWWKYEENLRVD